MQESNRQPESATDPEQDNGIFYRHVLETLAATGAPVLVGGTYALTHYTGIIRQTKDLDLFVREHDIARVGAILREAGYSTEMVFPHWLAKVCAGDAYIDLVFNSGNGIARVDDAWFEHAEASEVLGVPARLCPAEETIWSKAFIMERERYDGADIVHLLHACAPRLDWARLLRRFGPHWRVLLSHLVLFGFVFPAQRDLVPAAVMDELLERLRRETHSAPPQHDVCLGTLLSREQYLNDVGELGLRDGRLQPFGAMSAEDAALWTDAIPEDHSIPRGGRSG